ncbi:MAG TPA: SLC13 family permease [Burkholderiales bacterium]|nr:SLC13 family permease [Burkholderiales bacterium]
MPIEPHAVAVLALLVVAFALFASEKLPIETTSLLVLVLLAVGFQVFPFSRGGERVVSTDFFFGFGHEALVAICSLMILGRGLVVTGALEPASRLFARMLGAHPTLAMLPLLVICAAASGVLNDTPIVVLMMPVLVGAALRARTSPARTLLPMNFAVLLGGMGTTIGTSTNLIVVSIAADLGVRRFGMFDFIHVTALAAVGGIVYLWLVLPRLIPQRVSPLGDAAPQVFAAALHVAEGGFAEGKSLSEAQKKAGAAMRVTRVLRGKLELARLPTLVLQAGDRLYLTASAKDLHEFAGQLGASLHKTDEHEQAVDEEHPLQAEDQQLAEVVVTESSPLHRSTLRATRFGDFHDVVIVGLHRAAAQATLGRHDIGDTVLRSGDVLLVQGTAEAIAKLRQRARLLVLDQSYELPRTARAPVALAILAAVVALAALGLAPISVAALGGVAAMLLTRCLDWEDAAAALSMKVVLLVASSLALGSALEKTGATAWLADGFVRATEALPASWMLALLMLLMALFTNFVSNNAAAAVGTPIAVDIARHLGVSPEPLVLAIMFGANFCYVTPMAYQTNLLVMAAAGYRFADFVRAGLPLLLLMLASYALLLPRYFPL